jgi:hypothetical protein
MTQTHPITPPPELVQQWLRERPESEYAHTYIAAQAAQWGADQELEACLKALDAVWDDPANSTVEELQRAIRAARCPKPPSLKEQALEAWEIANQSWTTISDKEVAIIIRRALEALDD